MRKLIAKITGWPLVSFQYVYTDCHRFARKLENGEWYVTICGGRKFVRLNNSYHDFKPVMNCRAHGVPLFKENEE